MFFRDREEAAELLGRQLLSYKGMKPLVLAVPRGAVPMAKMIADRLDGDLDVVLVHKIGAPENPEYAIGSVSENGEIMLGYGASGVSQEYIARVAQDEMQRLRERRKTYTAVRPRLSPKGRIVIIVDDGVATGSTLLAAIKAVRTEGPDKIIAAVGVAPPDTARRLKREADELVVLDTPEPFFAVGHFFEDFRQVTDEEVIRALSSGRGTQPSSIRQGRPVNPE